MSNFTQEQIAAAKAAKTPEKLIAHAKEQGIELTAKQASETMELPHPPTAELSDNELNRVAGGEGQRRCQYCGSPYITDYGAYYECKHCHYGIKLTWKQ